MVFVIISWFCQQVRAALKDGTPMDHKVAQAIAEATIRLEGQGDIMDVHGFKAGKTWCNDLLREMNLRQRRTTTDGAKLPEDWETKGRRLGLQVCNASLCELVANISPG